jgi:hypothetical protein
MTSTVVRIQPLTMESDILLVFDGSYWYKMEEQLHRI